MSLQTHAYNLPGNKHNCSEVTRPTRDWQDWRERERLATDRHSSPARHYKERERSQLSGEPGAIEEIPASWIDCIPVILNNRHIPSWFFAAGYTTLPCLLPPAQAHRAQLASNTSSTHPPSTSTQASLWLSQTNRSSVCVCMRSQVLNTLIRDRTSEFILLDSMTSKDKSLLSLLKGLLVQQNFKNNSKFKGLLF